MKLSAPKTSDGGSSPLVKPKEEKQVEYLDLDLDPGKSTPPRKVGIVLHSLTQRQARLEQCVEVVMSIYRLYVNVAGVCACCWVCESALHSELKTSFKGDMLCHQ